MAGVEFRAGTAWPGSLWKNGLWGERALCATDVHGTPQMVTPYSIRQVQGLYRNMVDIYNTCQKGDLINQMH